MTLLNKVPMSPLPIQRQSYLDAITFDMSIFPICALLGPRQCGKTTIARLYASHQTRPIHYFDLEDYTDLAKLAHPQLTLEPLEGLIIIDEIQRRPDLFSYLRVLADRPHSKAQFLILGSASKDLLRQSSESLAGRISYCYVSPFHLQEVSDQKTLWTRGGFPRSFLASGDQESFRWRQSYLQTYFERDLVDLGLNIPPQRMLLFWNLLTQYHGQIINYAAMAQFMDMSVVSLKNYLALLEGTFMIRLLQPWYMNQKKRLVKTPKFYIRDSGIFHALLGLKSYTDVILNIHSGPSWEGFAMEEVMKTVGLRPEECFFWSTHQGAELDLYVMKDGKKIGFEFKVTDQPKITKSMNIAMEELALNHLFMITPVGQTFPLNDRVTVLSLSDIERALGNQAELSC